MNIPQIPLLPPHLRHKRRRIFRPLAAMLRNGFQNSRLHIVLSQKLVSLNLVRKI